MDTIRKLQTENIPSVKDLDRSGGEVDKRKHERLRESAEDTRRKIREAFASKSKFKAELRAE